MRNLSQTLLAAQQASSRVPYLKVSVSNRMAGVMRLKWQRFYEGAEPDNTHAVCMPADGSIIRIRVGPGEEGSKLYRQRVVNPGPASDFSTWALYRSVRLPGGRCSIRRGAGKYLLGNL